MDTPAGDFSPSSKGVKPLFVAIIILAIFVAGSVAYLGFTGGLGNLFGMASPKTTSNATKQGITSSSETEVAAFRLARKIVNDYSDSKLIVDTSIRKNRIEYVFRGKLVEFEASNRWTVEENGKRITLNADSDIPVEHFRWVNEQKKTETINSKDIDVGDGVRIRTGIDFDKGTMYVIRIVIITEPAGELPQESSETSI